MSYHDPQQQPVIVVQAPATSGAAVASLVFGLLGLFLGCCTFGVPSVLAVLLGHIAMRETKNGQRGGQGMAVAGLILGYLLVIPMILLSIQVVLGAGLDALEPDKP